MVFARNGSWAIGRDGEEEVLARCVARPLHQRAARVDRHRGRNRAGHHLGAAGGQGWQRVELRGDAPGAAAHVADACLLAPAATGVEQVAEQATVPSAERTLPAPVPPKVTDRVTLWGAGGVAGPTRSEAPGCEPEQPKAIAATASSARMLPPARKLGPRPPGCKLGSALAVVRR